MSNRQSERRRGRRRGADEHGVVTARIRPGYDVTLIDVSSGGALVETAHRLLPGKTVDLHMQAPDRQATLRGSVLRCSVARVRPASMCYRGAIAFDRHLPWFTEGHGYEVPFRGNVTPEVI